MSLFAPKTAAPSTGGLSINTGQANSLFGNANTAAPSNPTPAAPATGGLFGSTPSAPTTGGLFGSTSAAPATGGLFGSTSAAPATGGLFGSTSAAPATGGLFGSTPAAPATGGLFGSAPTPSTTQPKPTGSLFGTAPTTSQAPTTGSSMLGGLGGQTTTAGGGLFGNTTTQAQTKPALGALSGFGSTQNQQQQQPQKPSLNLFGNQNTGLSTLQPLQQPAATGTVVPGVKIDLSNLLPTTKFESCADEIRNQIEIIDNHILNQMKVCHEVSDMLPTIEQESSTIPNDVDFVQGKLETLQHALENDASDIDHLRGLVARDAAEAQVAFRAIDTLKLPLQYQSAGGGWWSVQDPKVSDRRSLRSTRKNTLALPDDVDGDPSTATAVNGVPVNLVDYFSQRSDEMGTVLTRYKGNLKEIEDHLHGVELTLERQISEFISSKSRDGMSSAAPSSVLNDLTAVLADVEAGIIGVASRLGGVSEQVQELSLGPLSRGDRLGL
ncbi:hypothetical protein N7495_006489 [Penicillium taxi]|uniref:uncharacterized protein n=1 Tax=Penicillium taxi TaxID=168475 RepID=UPI002545A4EA|nr:uncharacterized protein N7495_006489 [Penicillium taxi]KAJ5894798.1 hypothetical protein N7495_006489 [Penicillium taxi]